MSDEISLGGLFFSSFLAATLLPGGSEAVLFGVLKLNPGLLWPALVLATLGNTLGGMSSYLLGRILPNGHDSLPEGRPHLNPLPQAGEEANVKGACSEWLAFVRRYGSPALLLAWAPLVGDALCVAAGWLRLNAVYVALFMAAGKLARYLAIAWTAV
ncbi:MAG: DedA family protein [Sulfuricella sp.]|nr:DedA family protein [Sulfuricella sp.]